MKKNIVDESFTNIAKNDSLDASNSDNNSTKTLQATMNAQPNREMVRSIFSLYIARSIKLKSLRRSEV